MLCRAPIRNSIGSVKQEQKPSMDPVETPENCLHIVGASVRAAAQSVRRAGWSPVAWDLFADADLKAFCPAHRVDWNRSKLENQWDRYPPGPWIYTGCLENSWDLVDRLSTQRELLGNGGAVLRQVRNPFLVHAFLSKVGFSVPQVRRESKLPNRGTWVLKPRRSGGGFRMRVWKLPAERAEWAIWREQTGREESESYYWQEFVPGTSCSAVYIAHPDRTLLVGATEQLIGSPPASDSPFRYLGSVGPLRLSRLRQPLERLGSQLTTRFQLRGIFGVDFIRRGSEVIPVEVNPRYPASCELLERATERDVLSLHVAACRGQPLPTENPRDASCSVPAPIYHGKGILYARRPLLVTSAWSERLLGRSLGEKWPPFADVPSAGEEIGTGHPILTVFRQGHHLGEVRRALKRLTCPMNKPN